MNFLLKGIIIGFSIAAPVGPIGILCIRRTLQFGRLSGLFSGLGAAAADTIFGIVAAFGLTFVSDFLLAERIWLHLIGGVFLIYLGYKTFMAKSMETAKKVTHKTLFSDFFSTFFLTLANPLTILSFVAIFASIGLSDRHESALALVLGVFIGSSLWWLILSEGITLFRTKFRGSGMIWINRIAGLVICAFGVLAISLIL